VRPLSTATRAELAARGVALGSGSMTANAMVAILAGGSSSRMGTDKARLVVDGSPLIDHVATALARYPQVVVGGSADLIELISTDARWVPDHWPGEGPLGAIITALKYSLDPDESTDGTRLLLTVGCDLVDLSPALVTLLIDEAVQSNADVCVPLIGGYRQWHVAVWNARTLQPLADAFESGIRSPWRAAMKLRQTVVTTTLASPLIDLDTPDDVSRYSGAR